jgi:ATP-binding cassette subfamily B protein/subfamily B ATP-binding cassette protein MsbA
MVLQDTLLFSTTVRENIAYGRPDATEDEIIEAAKRAQAYDFVMRMSD